MAVVRDIGQCRPSSSLWLPPVTNRRGGAGLHILFSQAVRCHRIILLVYSSPDTLLEGFS